MVRRVGNTALTRAPPGKEVIENQLFESLFLILEALPIVSLR